VCRVFGRAGFSTGLFGHVTVRDPEHADRFWAKWFISFDRACHVQLLARAARTPQRWPAEMARGLSRGLGSPEFGWLSFQTLWDEIVESDPDLFD